MKILFTTQALSIGGIEVLALRLSEAFGKAGHEVLLYDFNPDRCNQGLVSQYDTSQFRLAYFSPGPVVNQLIWKTNALLFRTGLVKDFRARVIARHFAHLLAREHPDVICSLSFHQDYLACVHAMPLGIPVVVSMHGTYEYAAPEWSQRAHFIYQRTKAFIYAAAKNMSWYQAQPYWNPALPAVKIYTGADLDAPLPRSESRARLGLPDDAFVYIMVARGIREKGWQEAIEAFGVVRARHARAALLLVGDGEYLRELQTQYKHEPGVIFYGNHPNSLALTVLADVGLLPSYFPIETLPNVIIDYLRCRLPVIASDIGEIPGMLTLADGGVAGAILSRQGHGQGVCMAELAQEMEQLLIDPACYQVHAQQAAEAVLRFDLRECMARYMEVFNQALHSKNK